VKTNVRVAVIGGGVVGCSVLYHLTKLGWSDVVLLERSELTSGSTWHAAGGMHTLNSDPNIAKLQDYTIRLYKEIEEISGHSCGVHLTGGYMLAADQDRLDWLKTAFSKGRNLGFESRLASLEEVAREMPILDASQFVGALYDPFEGHVDPSGVTHAYAKAARVGGAEVYRETPVIETNQRPDGSWDVVTAKGTLNAEVLVNAGGLWAREVGAMAGVHLPLLAMEHQYLITEPIQEVIDFGREVPHAIDFAGEIYLRQEGQGLLIGTYEQECRPWSPDRTPDDFGHELLQPDLERIAPSLEVAFRHIPPLANAGIKQTINGPFTFAPDGNPLIGPVPGLRNYFVACGVMAGFSQGGGVGRSLAEWIIEGEPSMDVFAMDVARYGSWAGKSYTYDKVQENYRRRFSIVYPNEERPAGRPLKTTPIYDQLKRNGAVFGAAYGLEHALWFAPDAEGVEETPTFRRSNAFGPVGEECRAVREAVGLMEISSFAKYEVTGPGAEVWLLQLLANRMPQKGRMLLSPMLNPKGRLIGDFTVARLGPERFMLFGSGTAEGYHMRWFQAQLRDGGTSSGVTLRSLCSRLTGLSIAGPQARTLLQRLTRDDVSNEAFPFLHVREMTLGYAPSIVARISFTGELGYEIYMPPEYQRSLYEALRAAGEDLGLRLFGGRALNSLRLEKGFGSWTREYTPDYTPFQAGLGRFVDLRKNSFNGRDAVAAAKEETPNYALRSLVIEVEDADAWADEPILRGDEVVGFITSGGYGHTVGQSLALAYLKPDRAERGSAFEVEILGSRRPARLLEQPLYDPKGERMRG